MSAKHYPGVAALLLLGAFAALPASAQGQKSDLIDKLRAQNEIAAQKMEADFREAMADAQRLSSDPARALERLQKVLGQLEADRALTPQRRDLLTRQLKDRIRVATQEADRLAAKNGPKGRDPEARSADTDQINRSLIQIRELQKAGKTADAKAQAEDLFRRHPNLAAPQAIGKTSSVLDHVAYLNQMREDSAGKRIGAMNNVDRAALAPGSDMEFPKDWATRVAQREAGMSPTTSKKEKEILSSLNKEVSVDYKGGAFFDVIEDLSTKLGVPILLDKNSLADALVTSDTQVNFAVKGVKARTVLRKVLGEVGLAYIIKDETIQVVTERQAKETMVTKTYFLGSIIAGGPLQNSGLRWWPGISQFEALQNVLSVVNLIQSTVDPPSWQANGGQGTIAFHAPSMALIIRNSAEVHGMMGGYGK
ncbi:MAG: hypothetical protein JNM56_39440 [Planctomycetia bacterium]|nr:hypothetical protein [Planctomycetia bacterium]